MRGDRSTAGVDIVQERREARQEAKAVEAQIAAPTFEECAEAYIRAQWSTWSEKHRDQWPSSLKRYAYPTIGKLTIAEIKPSHIHELLEPIWVDQAGNRQPGARPNRDDHREKRQTSTIMDFRNPAELTKQLREKLPKRPKRVVRHHPALPYVEAAQFMSKLCMAEGRAAAGVTLPDLHRLPHERNRRCQVDGD